jgi:hypothetical protein
VNVQACFFLSDVRLVQQGKAGPALLKVQRMWRMHGAGNRPSARLGTLALRVAMADRWAAMEKSYFVAIGQVATCVCSQ